MPIARAFWDWVIDRRRVKHRSKDEARAFAILNIVCLLALASILSVVSMILWFGAPFEEVKFDLLQNGASFVMYAFCWILVRRGSALVSTIVLACLGNLQITLLVLYYGFGGGIQWFYGVLMAAPLVTIPGPKHSARLLLAALPLALFIWTHYEFRILGRQPLATHDPSVAIFFFSNSLFALLILGSMVAYFRYAATRAERALELEQKRSEDLLLNILPDTIASRLKKGETLIADRFEHTTVLFADLVHFTRMSAERPPEEVVQILDEVFSQFDEATRRWGLEKVKTIGDAYMAIGGAPEAQQGHAARSVGLALDMIALLAETSARLGRQLELRIGIHTGPVVGGVIGKNKFAYDFWGDTVNTASRMESHGLAGRVHISEETKREIADFYETEERGKIEVKGKGVLTTYFIAARR
jgi:adenylate cyclase